MASHQLHLSLITPEAKIFESDVDFVALPAHDGEIGVMFNRAPLVCQLGAGLLKARMGSTEQTWFVDAGFVQVLDNRVVVLTQKAIKPEQLDREEATRQLEETRQLPTNTDEQARKRARIQASARAKIHAAGAS